MSKPLNTEVLELLKVHKGSWKTIATAADVSHSWISKFVRGLIENPGYRTLEKLRDHMRTLKKPTPAAESKAGAE